VRAVGVAHEPLIAPIDPDVEPVLGNEPDRCLRDLWRQWVGVDHGEIRLDEDAAVEGGNGRVDPEGIREHDHAAWRAAARDGEADPLLMQSVDCSPRPFGQHFVMRNERPVHVGKQ
jgi:hypothetical protein